MDLKPSLARVLIHKLTRREFAIALLVALVLAAIPIGRAIFDRSLVFFPVDAGAAQAPWSAASEPEREREYVDSGVAQYPAYRHTIEALARGELPKWNPNLGVGVPWLANPRVGVLDPGTWFLALLEKWGGRDLSDQGFAWLAWWRLAAALLGAYVFARQLGTSRAAASLAAIGFAGSGALLWIHSSVGHVAPLVPWIFVALERVRERASFRRAALVGLALALAILAGNPETAFFAGLAALAWSAFALEGRARAMGFVGLAIGIALAAPMLVPFVEALQHSGVLIARKTALDAAPGFDFMALGLVAIAISMVVAWRGLDSAKFSESQGFVGALGLVLGLSAVLYVLSGRGLGEIARTTLLVDALGSVAAGNWEGPGRYAEVAIAWVPTVVFALALAAFFAREGHLRSRSVAQWIALVALLLAIGTPGAIDVWRKLPFFGGGATSRAACVAALFLGVIAAEALDAAPRMARKCAALALVAFVGLALTVREPAPPTQTPDAPDAYFACTELPPAILRGGFAALGGYVGKDLPCDELVLRVERSTQDARDRKAVRERVNTHAKSNLFALPLPLATPDAEGRRAFHVDDLEVARLGQGTWRFSLDIFVKDADGHMTRSGTRNVAYSVVSRQPVLGTSGVFVFAAFLLVLFVAGLPSHFAWIAVACAALQAFVLANGALVSAPRERSFHPTRTEAILAAELGDHRMIGGPSAFTGNTALVSNLATIGGQDVLAPASFEAFKTYALKFGADPRLDWNARGLDLTSAAFRALGVKTIALAEPAEQSGLDPTSLDLAGFDLVAGPTPDCPRASEAFLYGARDPMPRAFCVARIVERKRGLADVPAFDIAREAFLDDNDSWRPTTPFTTASVERIGGDDEHARFRVTLDGDGLLVTTDQAFPGWKARVDGELVAIHTADALFRAVPLAKGAHTIEFAYEPMSFVLGAWIGCIAFLALWTCIFVPSRLPRETLA